MHGQEREHAALLEQMPRYRLDIQQIPLIVRPPLHPEITPTKRRSTGRAARITQGRPSLRLVTLGLVWQSAASGSGEARTSDTMPFRFRVPSPAGLASARAGLLGRIPARD